MKDNPRLPRPSRVLEVEGCRSSVVRALVAKASGLMGSNPRRQLRFFHIFPLPFSRPLYMKKFQSSFYEGSELDNCNNNIIIYYYYYYYY